MICDRCGNPTAATYGGLCDGCVVEVNEGMHQTLAQGDEGATA